MALAGRPQAANLLGPACKTYAFICAGGGARRQARRPKADLLTVVSVRLRRLAVPERKRRVLGRLGPLAVVALASDAPPRGPAEFILEFFNF
jgi:hypothetical protein